MIRKNTWFVLGIFAALLILVWYLQRKPSETPVSEPTLPASQATLLDVTYSDLVGIRVEGKEGMVEFTKVESDLWAFVSPKIPIDATDSDKIDQAAAQVPNLAIVSKLSAPPSLKTMGLDTPAYTLTFTLQNGDVIVVYVGDKTPVGNGYYVAVQGQVPTVVSTFSIDSFINILTELPIKDTPTPTLEETPTPEVTATPES